MKYLTAIASALLLAACTRTTPQAIAAAKGDDAKIWGDNFAAAQAEAKATGRPIFAFFTGSDWCGWCIRLHREVLEKEEFKTFAANNLILFEADFPRGKQLSDDVTKQNKDLMEKYGVRGFPTIFLLDAEGKALGETGYKQGGAAAYVEHLQAMFKKAGLKIADAAPAKVEVPTAVVAPAQAAE